MKALYPLKFHPIMKERMWAGTKLREVLGKPDSGPFIGESWEVSGVAGDVSVVSNGPLSGTALDELINSSPDRLLGTSVHARFGKEFPVLIKYIDAKLDLSVQVHPGDELAKARHNSFGKTEMWYIMDADKDSRLIIGFNRDVGKAEYEGSLESNTIMDLLNYVPVTEGDTFFINNGRIHAIGAGILLAEIQQTSDITYRVYDFDRMDQHGKKRELHTQQALDAIDFRKVDDYRVLYPKRMNASNSMVQSPYFITDYLELNSNYTMDVGSRDSFTIFLCVSGMAYIANEAGKTPVKRGETVLVPAETQTIVIETGGAKFLDVSL